MSKPTTPARPTRQLLDELDALMQKMLTLPVEETVPPRVKSEPTSEPRSALRSEPKPESAPPAVAATLTLFDGAQTADRAAFEVGASEESDEPQSVSAEDLIDSEEDADEEVEHPAGPHLSRWRALTKQLHTERAHESEEESEDEEIEDETESEADESSDDSEEFTLPEPPPMPANDRSALYEAGLTWEAGFRRWTRPFGWAVNNPQGRFVLGILGLSMWLGAAAWLVRDYMQWPR